MRRLWPLKLTTPYVELGVPIARGIAILEATGGAVFAEMDGESRTFRVNLSEYEMAIYDGRGFVSSVWYNRPGRSIDRSWEAAKDSPLH